MTEYVDEEGNTHVDIQQTATGGIKGTLEKRTLAWTEAKHEDGIFGKVAGMRSLFSLPSHPLLPASIIIILQRQPPPPSSVR